MLKRLRRVSRWTQLRKNFSARSSLPILTAALGIYSAPIVQNLDVVDEAPAILQLMGLSFIILFLSAILLIFGSLYVFFRSPERIYHHSFNFLTREDQHDLDLYDKGRRVFAVRILALHYALLFCSVLLSFVTLVRSLLY